MAALGQATAESAERMREVTTLEDYVGRYLAADHRDRRGEGCVMAALAAEIPRQAAPVRHGFTATVRAMMARIARLVADRRAPEDEALAIMATMVGALMLARAVDEPDLSDRILDAARVRLAPSGGPSGAEKGT